MQVNAAVALVLLPHPVMEGMTVNGDGAGALNGVIGTNRARLQRCRSSNDLKDRARRHMRLGGLVEQRLLRVLRQPLPFLPVDAMGEAVWVEVGMADHGQHLAGVRIESHYSASAVAQRHFR